MKNEPSRLQLWPRGSDGLLRLSFTGSMSDGLAMSRRVGLVRELLRWSRPAALHAVISADDGGDWSWADPWRCALAVVDCDRLYVLHALRDRRDGR